ncbi:MAG: Diguanylate cyclase [Ignavibacteria bacterium]|nr:Diguanylate cyclase [Ignavibacteria bacterium]
MPKRKVDFKKLFAPADILPLIAIIGGILIAVFVPETAIRLIGGSVAVLGIVGLFMLVSQRFSEIVEIKTQLSIPPPNYSIVEKKDKSAKRQIFEGFDSDDMSSLIKAQEKPKDFAKTDEGFRIITKPESASPTPKKDLDELEQVESVPETPVEEDVITVQEPEPQLSVIVEEVVIIEQKEEFVETIVEIHEKPVQVAKEGEPSDIAPTPELEETAHKLIDEAVHDAMLKHEESEQPQAFVPPIRTTLIPQSESLSTLSFEKSSEPVSLPLSTEEAETQERISFLKKSLFQISEPHPPKFEEPVLSEKFEIVDEKQAEPALAFTQLDNRFKSQPLDISGSVFFEEIPLMAEEPRLEFEYFLARVLTAIRSMTNTRTAAFVLINSEKQQLVVEAMDTTIKDAVPLRTKLPMRNDVITQIVLSSKPEILTEINPAAELDLIPYYSKPTGTMSFIGVPVFYKKSVVGVLCADSSQSEAYDSFTVVMLGHFTKLISAMVHSYTDKYDLLQASRTLSAINQFRSIYLRPEISQNDIIELVVETASTIFEFSTIGVCGYDVDSQGWVIKAIRTQEKVPDSMFDKFIDLKNSCIGETILTEKPIFLSPIEEDIICVHPEEIKPAGGFFVSVPLKSTITGVYGALYVEGDSSINPSSLDLEILETLGEHAGTALEKFQLLSIIQTDAMTDTMTGLLNPPAFFQRLEEEYYRSSDQKNTFALCVFRIDRYAALDPKQFHERNEKVTYHILKITKKLIKKYDVFGKLDETTYAIILLDTPLEKAHNIVKKLRQEIAGTVIHIDNKTFSTTVSIGVADNLHAETLEIMVSNANKVLNISMERSNWVSVYY